MNQNSLSVRRYKEVLNDAALPLITDPNIQGGDRYYSIGTNTLFTLAGAPGARVWLVTTAGAGAMALPLHQIAYGTGAGVASNANFRWDSATNSFRVEDQFGVGVFVAVGGGGARGIESYDSAGIGVFGVDTSGANRNVNVNAEGGGLIERWSTTAATRNLERLDSGGIIMKLLETRAAVRTEDWRDPAGTVMTIITTTAAGRNQVWQDAAARALVTIDCKSANRTVLVQDEAGANVLEVFGTAANAKIVSTVPIRLGLFTLAQANALTAAQGKVEGAECYITNGLKPTEVAGGTGVPAYYSAGGPAGAGWYNFGLATLVAV